MPACLAEPFPQGTPEGPGPEAPWERAGAGTAAGGLQMFVGAAPSGSAAASLCRPLEGTAQASLPAGTGMAGMSLGTIFKA